jgi:formate/nitrite transporter
VLARYHEFGGAAVGRTALEIVTAKCELSFVQAVALGMGCNALVCLGVWLCFSARSTTDRILAILFPISAFVATGMEHSVANMYYIPLGLLIKGLPDPAFWESIGSPGSDFSALTWQNFCFANLLPVTLGNIVGGSVMVGIVYWFVYLRPRTGKPG